MGKNATSAAVGQRGFTLVELLVVIAIIGVLIALLVGGVAKAYQLAKNMHCQHNLSQIAKAVISYTTANRGSIPPTRTTKTDGRILNWCNLLATQGIDAQNTASADQKQGTDPNNKQRSGQDSILLCPSSSLLYCDPAATWTDPTDPLAQGWCRLPLQQGATVMIDTSYYWNGYVGTDPSLLGRFPSELLDENETDPTRRAAQVHDVAEIKNRSRMVMVADGVYFQGDIGGSGGGTKGGLNPERIAARHPGGHKGGGVTNLGFYDGHVESMDRYPDPDWANETVEGFDNITKESTTPSVSPLVPIMNKKLRPDPGLDLSPADIRNGLGPMFLLPRR
jgi:prepilin-type N-terminal cleavage/methylation domain-containing protein/prepilin-type processing-associated H-X9-DG protein